MIRPCQHQDFETILTIINDGAYIYKGIIPEDRWNDPYMSGEHLERDINDGIVFWGFENAGELTGVMGIQPVEQVTLIRHAYVRTRSQNLGIGKRLLEHLRTMAHGPVLIGTWAEASWAIRFYQKHGFSLVAEEEKDRLLRKYWKVPDRQIETSVVLCDQAYRDPADTLKIRP